MRPSLLRRLDTFARQVTPFALTVVLVLCNVVPLRIPGLEAVAPSLPLISVFYWSLYRPDLMPAAAVFAIGLLQDTVSGAIIGISAAIFILVHAAVCAQRRFFLGKPFVIVWLGFALIAVAAFCLGWMLTSMIVATLIEVPALLARTAVTIGCFPAVAWLLLRCQVALLRSV